MVIDSKYSKKLFDCDDVWIEMSRMFGELHSRDASFNPELQIMSISFEKLSMDEVVDYMYTHHKREDGQFTYRGRFYDPSELLMILLEKSYRATITIVPILANTLLEMEISKKNITEGH